MSVRQSLLISFVEKYLTLVISFASIMTIARLLTPREIGIYSVASAVTGMAQMLRDFGIGSYLIQERDLSRERLRTALSVAMITSWSAGLLVYGCRDWAAAFYHEPGIRELMAVQALQFILLPFSGPVLALLRREMRFKVILRISLLSSVVQLLVAVGLAQRGYGYLSLAWASLAGLACTVLMVSIKRPAEAWLRPGLREWRHIARFGVQASSAALVTELAMNMNDLILGRMLGFQAAALYSRAQGLMYLFHHEFMDAIRKVALPAFSQAVRQQQPIRDHYLQAVSHITAVAWPFYAFLGCYAQPIVRVLFGDQWLGAVPLVSIVVIAGAIGALSNLSLTVLTALGEMPKLVKSELLVQTVRVGLVFYAASISVEMSCYALIAIYSLQCLITLHYLQHCIAISMRQLLRYNLKSLLLTAISLLPPLLIREQTAQLPEWQALAIAGSVCLLSWLLGIATTRHPLWQELKMLLQTRSLQPQHH